MDQITTINAWQVRVMDSARHFDRCIEDNYNRIAKMKIALERLKALEDKLRRCRETRDRAK